MRGWSFHSCTPSQWDSHIFLPCWINRCAWVQIIDHRMREINKGQTYLFLTLRRGVTAAGTGVWFSPFITPWCCVTIIHWQQWTEPWTHLSYMPRCAVNNYQLVILVTQPDTNFNMHHLCWFFTQNTSSSLYWADVTWLVRETMSIPFTWILYKCSKLVGVDEADKSSLGVMFYQYMASIIGQLFRAAILFTVQWHLSIIVFPDSLYVQCDQNQTPYSSTNHLNCWWQKAVSLLARIFTGTPHLKNTNFKCWITCAVSCNTNKIESCMGPHSIRVKK